MTDQTRTVTKSVTVSFPFLSILTLIFITLKLLKVITWSWWWVLAPLWAPYAIILGITGLLTLFAGVVFAAAWVVDEFSRRRRR